MNEKANIELVKKLMEEFSSYQTTLSHDEYKKLMNMTNGSVNSIGNGGKRIIRQQEAPFGKVVYTISVKDQQLESLFKYEEQIKESKHNRELARVHYDNAMEDFIDIVHKLNTKEIKKCQKLFNRLKDLKNSYFIGG